MVAYNEQEGIDYYTEEEIAEALSYYQKWQGLYDFMISATAEDAKNQIFPEDFDNLNRAVNYGPLAVLDNKARAIDMMIIAPAREVELDKTGRLSIPQVLREFAGLEAKTECVILGSMSKIEIISTKRYEEMMIQYKDVLSDIGDALSSQRMGL